MAGREALDLVIRVRILVPEPETMDRPTGRHEKKGREMAERDYDAEKPAGTEVDPGDSHDKGEQGLAIGEHR